MGSKVIPFNEFINRFYLVSKGEYEYISGYTRMSKKIKIKHLLCGHEYNVIASSFINTKVKCKKCSDKKRGKTTIENEFNKKKEAINKITNGEYELLSYNGNKKKSIILHKKCNCNYEVTYNHFYYRGHRCRCGEVVNKKYTLKEFNEKYNIEGVEILSISYPGPKIKIKCNYCNSIKEMNVLAIKNYKYMCCKKSTKDNNKKEQLKIKEELIKQKERKRMYTSLLKEQTKFYIYKKEVDEMHNNNITIKEIVYNTSDKFLVKCNTCEHEWYTNFHKLKQGRGCPLCKSSRGEKIINKFLINNKYNFEREYKFKNSKVSSLRFDFAVFIKNKIKLIEFDGMQHFSVDYQFGEENKEDKFSKTVERDKRKNEFCEKHKIDLLRIPYYDIKNTDKLLKEFLK